MGGGGPPFGKNSQKIPFFFWKTPLILFDRSIQVLVSTDCAGMGVHVPDLRLVVNVGMTMIEIASRTHHSFIIIREALPLTLSIFTALYGCIS